MCNLMFFVYGDLFIVLSALNVIAVSTFLICRLAR